MISLLQRYFGNTIAAPIAFLLLFLVIGGAALYLTPRIAAWLDRKEKKNHSFYEGMLTEDPRTKEESGGEEDKEREEENHDTD